MDKIELLAPQIPYHPEAAIKEIRNIIEEISKTQLPIVIASSMGAYFTNHVAHDVPLSACLVNPGVDPFNRVIDYIDREITHPYTQEKFILSKDDFKYLKSLQKYDSAPNSNFWVFLKKEDEVLNYHFAADLYRNHKLQIDEGGDHSFHDFDKYIDSMINWLYLKAHPVDR